jgi:hypothetical protein
MSNNTNVMPSRQLVRIISICNSSHADVWKLTSNLLPRFVKADAYFVYVPESEIVFFEKITDPRIIIKSQENLGGMYRESLYKKLKEAGNDQRFGWYIQQFYKLEIIFQEDAGFDVTVIWDSDCVPTRNIPLLDHTNKLIYMSAAQEVHEEYFLLIKRLLSFDKLVNFSFVIPGFPILQDMGIALRKKLELNMYPDRWFEALLRNIHFDERSGLSETELLGTWIVHEYPHSWTLIEGHWERRGQKRFGYARKLNPKRIEKLGLEHDLDIISFENWDTRGIKLIFKRALEKIGLTWRN